MPNVTVLPFDLKGTMSSNRRTGEQHTLTQVPNRVNRMFTPEFGAFYTSTLEVRTSTGTLLKRDVDYVVTYYYVELGELTAQEICAIIVVTNPAIPNDVRITYQAVGGPYSLSVKELAEVLDFIANRPTKIKWEDIVDKPLAYQPDDHTHEYWQLYGLESTVVNLDLLGDAYLVGNKAVIADNRFFYQAYLDQIKAAIDAYRVKVVAHIQDFGNPHQTDKVKIKLGNVNNWGMATLAESTNPLVVAKYLPIGGIYNQLVAYAVPLLETHIANKNNPHQVKLTDPLLDLWSIQEINDLFAQKLHRTQVANDSAALTGIPNATVYTNIRSNLAISNVDPGTKFTQAQLAVPAPSFDSSAFGLTGNNNYASFETLMKKYNVGGGGIYFVGSNGNYNSRDGAVAKIKTYSWVPIGTWVIGAYSYLWFAPGRVPVYSPFLVVYQRVATGDGWQSYI